MVTEKIDSVNPVKSSKKTVKRIKPSIRREAIAAADYNRYVLPFSCEECSHFSTEKLACTLGLYSTPHLEKNQRHDYELSGQMALCRFQEID